MSSNWALNLLLWMLVVPVSMVLVYIFAKLISDAYHNSRLEFLRRILYKDQDKLKK